MIQKGLPGVAEQVGKLGPGIRAAHVYDSDRFDPRLRGFGAKEARGLATLDTAPELALGCDDKMLVERISMGGDFDPFAAAGDHCENGTASREHPHIVLQLRHVLLG